MLLWIFALELAAGRAHEVDLSTWPRDYRPLARA